MCFSTVVHSYEDWSDVLRRGWPLFFGPLMCTKGERRISCTVWFMLQYTPSLLAIGSKLLAMQYTGFELYVDHEPTSDTPSLCRRSTRTGRPSCHTPESSTACGAQSLHSRKDSGCYSRTCTPTLPIDATLRASVSSASTDSCNGPASVFLDALRNIRQLLTKTPLEMSREAQRGVIEVTSSHGLYHARNLEELPDPGCVLSSPLTSIDI